MARKPRHPQEAPQRAAAQCPDAPPLPGSGFLKPQEPGPFHHGLPARRTPCHGGGSAHLGPPTQHGFPPSRGSGPVLGPHCSPMGQGAAGLCPGWSPGWETGSAQAAPCTGRARAASSGSASCRSSPARGHGPLQFAALSLSQRPPSRSTCRVEVAAQPRFTGVPGVPCWKGAPGPSAPRQVTDVAAASSLGHGGFHF